jgi:hypothetical protein
MFITILWKVIAMNFIHGDWYHKTEPAASVKYRFASADNSTHRGVFYVQV